MTAPVSEAPVLSPDQLRKELEALHAKKHRSLRSALFAQLPEGTVLAAVSAKVAPDKEETFRVVVASGELHLRRCLTDEPDETTVYLVPFARRLPRDLEAAFADGRVHTPAAESLLPLRFGARTATPRFLRSKLRLVAQGEPARTYVRADAATDAPSIDLHDAWLVFLADRLGGPKLETDAQLFTAALLDRDHGGRALAETLKAVPGARQELEDVLALRLGQNALRVLAGWLGDAMVDLAAMAVIGEATQTALADPRGKAFAVLMPVLETRVLQAQNHPLRGPKGENRVVGLPQALVELGAVVPLVWSRLEGSRSQAPMGEGTNHEILRRAILDEAERALASDAVRAFAEASNRLPFVFEDRRRRFVEAVTAVVEAKATARAHATRALDAAAAALLQHDAARGLADLAQQVEMACRLAAFLGEPVPPTRDTARAELVELARFQADVGGYVDWARQVSRLDVSGPLDRSLAPLVARVDAVRDALDARFAAAYATIAVETGGRATLRGPVQMDKRQVELVLIEDALARMGLDALASAPDLRFLVLCMDGMSGANLAEIWNSDPAARFQVMERRGQGPRWPILAQLPTITRLSRSALFAGRAPVPGDRLETELDGDRLEAHGSVRAASASSTVLLRRDVFRPGGGLADDAARAVQGPLRVVGVVVNAIDDQLKGSAQLRVDLSASRIPALGTLLEEAANAGRIVVLVSDHGNISSQRFIGAAARPESKAVEGAERGARHRSLRKGEKEAPDEVVVPFGALPAAPGCDRLALAVSETLRYAQHLHAGEHGGASLAEAIAAGVVLAPIGLAPDLVKHGFKETEFDPPAFWSRERRMAAAAGAAVATPARRRATPKPGPVALPPAAPPAAPQQVAMFSLGFVEALVATKLYQSQLTGVAGVDHAPIRKAIQVLEHSGWSMSRGAFAEAMGIGGVRVPGFLSKLERVLNFDQEPIVAMDPQSQLVVLNVRLLKDTFECDG